jgi:hypothetical protein
MKPRSFACRLAVGAVACVALAQGVASAADPIRITQPVNATKADLDPLRTWAAPSLLVHPDNPKLIVAGVHEFRDKKCGLMRSTDGGQTWTLLDADPSLPSYPFCLANNSNVFQANLAWGRNNTLYMGMVAWDTQDTRSKASISVARSTDLGDSWTTVIAHDARPSADPQQISLRPVMNVVVDTERGNDDIVYVSYRYQFQNQPTGSLPGVEAYVAVSKDGGRTFTPVSVTGTVFDDAALRQRILTTATTTPGATTTTAPANSLAANPDQKANFGTSTNGHGMAIDGDGTVYVAWPSQAFNNVVSGQPRGVFVSKSTDQGQTWTTTQVRDFSYENRGNTRIAWSPKGGADGTLHLVFEANPRPEVNSYSDVYYQRSTDGGATWSEARRITDDNPANLAGKYLPYVRVAPNGRVDVAWWDTRDDPGIRANDVYYTYSEDNGDTWAANRRITDQTIDRRFGVWGNNFDQNSPPGLASTDEYALLAWDDTRLSRGEDGRVVAEDPVLAGEGVGGGVQDVFVSAVQFETIGGGTSSAAKAVLAGVVGLVAVGLVLLIVVMAGRRRSGPPPERAVKGKTPAGVS